MVGYLIGSDLGLVDLQLGPDDEDNDKNLYNPFFYLLGVRNRLSLLLKLIIDRLSLIDVMDVLSWIAHELLLRLGIGGWHRLRLAVAGVSGVGSIEHTLNGALAHIGILECHILSFRISPGSRPISPGTEAGNR